MGTDREHYLQGQAMIELTIGMVSLLVLMAVIAQLAMLVRAGHETGVRARMQAGGLALQEFPISASAQYIGATASGPDQKPYTRDDQFMAADPAAFEQGILNALPADTSDWNTLDRIPGNAFSRLRASETPMTVFGLLRGEASDTVLLLPAVQHLLYRSDHIVLEETVWMPWTRGIY